MLCDSNATKANILDAFLAFASDDIELNDRLLVFFAGHGHTVTGNRGEVGFLVPVDGNSRKVASLIRWDDLTRNSDLIPAKHLLFIMDACYGGLAITRALAPGSMRFVKDMLLRSSRQVITAGKANEVVADAGGPIPGHSIFTGHFLQALHGNAASDGVITANGVMAYVYDRVARDQHSAQTPHYGYLSGDGDFIFAAAVLAQAEAEPGVKDEDILVAVPTGMPPNTQDGAKSDLDRAKEYLAEPRDKIRLDDLVARKTRQLVPSLYSPDFSTQKPVDKAEIPERLRKYEALTDEMRALMSVLGYWAQEQHKPTLRKALVRLCDQLTVQGGSVAWIGLRWYPIDLLTSAASIAALSARNYEALNIVLQSGVISHENAGATVPLCVALEDGLLDAQRTDVFKLIPGHDRHYVPKSEYLFKVLQPQLDDLLFLGNDYEELFDYSEILRALVYADFCLQNDKRFWGPIGRFGWKFANRRGNDPFTRVVDEAGRLGSGWPLLSAGFFGGDIDRFKGVATRMRDEILVKLPWF